MVSFKNCNNTTSEESTPHRHHPGTLRSSVNSRKYHQGHQHRNEPSLHVLPSRPSTHSSSTSRVCALHSRLDQPVTSSTPDMDNKKVVQGAASPALVQMRRKSGGGGDGSGIAGSGIRRRSGPQGLRSPAAKRPLSAPVALQGWLHKQGSEGLMLWKKRWFVLSEYCLFYYKGPEEEKLLGSILLPSYRVTACRPEDKANKKFAFKAEHANMRTYLFAADSRESMNQWVNALTLATLLQDPNPGGGDMAIALELAGPADGERSARPSVSSISSILNQSADDSDSGFHGFQSRDDPSHASNNNSSPNSVNTASFATLNNVHEVQTQPVQPVINGWMQQSPQYSQPGTSQQQQQQQPGAYTPLPGPSHQHKQQQHQQQGPQPGPSNVQTVQPMPRNFGQPLYANAPPKPRRLTEGSNEYSTPSPDLDALHPDCRKSPVSPDVRAATKSPGSEYERGSVVYVTRMSQPPQTLRTDKSGLNYGYASAQSQPTERRTPDTYGRSAKPRSSRGNGDYEDVYGAPQLYQRPAGPVGYTKGPAPAPIPIPVYAQQSPPQHPQMYAVLPTQAAPVMRQPRAQPPPRPHSADFLEYEATRRPQQQPHVQPGIVTGQQRRPQRPKSSLDVVNPSDAPTNDGYFYSEERYAAQMRQSAVYLHQTPQHHQQQRNQSLSRATTPSKPTSSRERDAESSVGSISETSSLALRRSQRDQSSALQQQQQHHHHLISSHSLQRHSEIASESLVRRSLRERSYEQAVPSGRELLLGGVPGEGATVPRRIQRDSRTEYDTSTGGRARRWNEQQFARSASARLPRTRHQVDRDEDDYAERSSGQDSRDGERKIQQREESMKRLLEWKQRMLQSPLTRKPASSGSRVQGIAQNELSSYYKQQAFLELAAHEASLAEARQARRRDDGHRTHPRSKSTDGRRSVTNNVSRYNSYSSDDEELGNVRHKRTRRPSHAGRSPRQVLDERTLSSAASSSATSITTTTTSTAMITTAATSAALNYPTRVSANGETVSSPIHPSAFPPQYENSRHKNASRGSRQPCGIPPDAGYGEIGFSPSSYEAINNPRSTVRRSTRKESGPEVGTGVDPKWQHNETPKKPTGILKQTSALCHPPCNDQSSNSEGRLSTLAGYIPNDTWHGHKNVQWNSTRGDKDDWETKIDEAKVIKEFSYQYIKPEQNPQDSTPPDVQAVNLVQSRIKSFESSLDETPGSLLAMQEPLKVSPPQATEAHVSRLDPTRNTTVIRDFALGDSSRETRDSVGVEEEASTDDGNKSVKDLLADFERKSQQAQKQENDKNEEYKQQQNRGVLSDTETLLYETGSDLDQPSKNVAEEDENREIQRSVNVEENFTGTIRRRKDLGDKSRKVKDSKAGSENEAEAANTQEISNPCYTRLSVTESLVTHDDQLSVESELTSPASKPDDFNPEEHYMPMAPRKAILDPSNERPNSKMMESLFASLDHEENSYVEMSQNGIGHSLLAPDDQDRKHDSGDYSTLDPPHYEFVCVADNKMEPVYMEVSQLADKEDTESSGKKAKTKRDSGNDVLPPRPDLPDILTALKSDSSDADDESSKDLDSLDAPRHPRFSLSDTFRPASYYLGASQALIAELHDSSDSELVSPPPIPTSLPPLDDLDSLEIQDSLGEAKKVAPQVAASRDSLNSRDSPKSWNKPAGQVETHRPPSRFSDTTISSTFRDSRMSLESASGSDSVELRSPEEEARHRQMKRRPVSDEVCEVLDSLDELESLGSRFDGASIDLDQYLEELQARDAFNVDLYAKDLSYNSIYGLNESMLATDKHLRKTTSQEISGKGNLPSYNTLDQPYQYGARTKTSSASSLPSMRVSDLPPMHQHSQSFTGDVHYENVVSFSTLRGSPGVRSEHGDGSKPGENYRGQKIPCHQRPSPLISHSRDSSYSLISGNASVSTSVACQRPSSAQSSSVMSQMGSVSPSAPGNGIPNASYFEQNRRSQGRHSRETSQDSARFSLSPNHRSSASQDSGQYPASTSTVKLSPQSAYYNASQVQNDQNGAPYYYSDLQAGVSGIDALINRNSASSRLPQLNNQRGDAALAANKRNDIGRMVNPIPRQMPRQIQVEDIDEARRIAAELRKSSTQFLAEKKAGLFQVDKRNIYEADTLRRVKSTDPLPDVSMIPDLNSRNIYPHGIRDKTQGESNTTPSGSRFQVEIGTRYAAHRRSRSLEGLLDDAELQNLVEQRYGTGQMIGSRQQRETTVHPSPVHNQNRFNGEDPWEQDSLWRESLRRVSLRHARSLDNLEASVGPSAVQDGRIAGAQGSKGRARITRGATYVNDSVILRREASEVAGESHRMRRRQAAAKDQDQSEAQGMQRGEEVDEGRREEEEAEEGNPGPEEETYERLAMDRIGVGGYIWDSENEAYRKPGTAAAAVLQQRDTEHDNRQNFLAEGNLPPAPAMAEASRGSTATSGSFEIDREKLRQWDLLSSACLLQEQQRTSMSESGRGLPTTATSRQEDGSAPARHQESTADSTIPIANETSGVLTFDTRRVPPGHPDANEAQGQDDGTTVTRGAATTDGSSSANGTASGSGSVIGRDPLPPRAISTSQLPQRTLTQPPLPRGNAHHPAHPVQQTTLPVTRPLERTAAASLADIRITSAGEARITSPGNGQLKQQHQDQSAQRRMAGPLRVISPNGHRVSSPNESESHSRSPSERTIGSPVGRDIERIERGGGSGVDVNGHGRQNHCSANNRDNNELLNKRLETQRRRLDKPLTFTPGENPHRGGKGSGGDLVQVSAGELLGRTHEELVLLLIQLRRQSATLCKAMETCHVEIESQARLAELDTPRRLENLQKLEELKKHLMDLEKQYEKGKPMVNLVDNMVKLGSLYNRGTTTNGTGGVSSSRHDLVQEKTREVRDRLEFNQRVQEQRLLAEERRDWDRLSPDHGQLQAKVQQLYKLDRLLQEESGTLHSLQQDKEILEKALGGLRNKLQGSRSNPAEVERYRKQQLLLERELSRVRLLLAHNSKKLEETVAENARLEQELVVLRQKLQASRRYAGNVTRDPSGTTAALEAELRRVQQLVGDLQRQRQELSIQVRQLTEKSHSLVQQIRPQHVTSPQVHHHRSKKRSHSSWLETDLDSGMTLDHGLDSPTSSVPSGSPGIRQNGSPHQHQHSASSPQYKDPPPVPYKEHNIGVGSTQHNAQTYYNHSSHNQQPQHYHRVSAHSPQSQISALSPQLREQIHQHQLKQQQLRDQMQGKGSPVQNNVPGPLYVNTDSRRQDSTKYLESNSDNPPAPPPEYVPPPPPPPSEEALLNGNYAQNDESKFSGLMHGREKQEIKTVRIVKRESERRQRDRGDRTGNIGIPLTNGLQVPGSAKRLNEDDFGGSQQFEKSQLDRVMEESAAMIHAQSSVQLSEMDDVQFQRSMSLPRGFGGQRPQPGIHQGPVPAPPRSDSMNALRNMMVRRHRVRFENQDGSSDSTLSPHTESPNSGSQMATMSSPNYSISPPYSPSHQNYSPIQYSRGGSGASGISGQGLPVPSQYYPQPAVPPGTSFAISSNPGSPVATSPPTAHERLFGSAASINSLRDSPQLSPVFKSEAARQIIKEMAEKRSEGPRRRPVPKEKRRHYTVSSSKPILDLEDTFSKMGMGRARDDLDMERALRPRINAPDVVRSTLSHKELKYNESTIDNLLGTPNKILIPERYIPEQLPELSAEEQEHRLKKAESIRKMLSETTVTAPENPEEEVDQQKSNTLKKKVAEEKRQREHILQLNQILAKQVMEKSKMVAAPAMRRYVNTSRGVDPFFKHPIATNRSCSRLDLNIFGASRWRATRLLVCLDWQVTCN
ncbi:serine/arginine repetitive matrix protein 2 isoform X1 [Neodiprion pinetum]|uniref:serine/arginine repetitive matrix protein 2 isoform X1 n=1 Tax=Neodiprion pinetum TaxID=441929 RepID=UPI00371A9CB6